MKFRNMRVHVQVGDLTGSLKTDWLTPQSALAKVMAFSEQRSVAQSEWENVRVWARRHVCGPNYQHLLTTALQDAWLERLDEGFYCCSPSFQQPRCNHSLFIPPFSEVDVLEQTCLRGVRGATRCVKKFAPTLGFPDSSYRRCFASLPKLLSLLITPGYLAWAAIGSRRLQRRRPVLPAGQQSTGRFILWPFSSTREQWSMRWYRMLVLFSRPAGGSFALFI